MVGIVPLSRRQPAQTFTIKEEAIEIPKVDFNKPAAPALAPVPAPAPSTSRTSSHTGACAVSDGTGTSTDGARAGSDSTGTSTDGARAGTMMRNGLAVVLSTLLGLLLLAGSGVAQEPKFPPLTGPLVDAAALLSPAAREEFDRSLRAYQQSSGYQLVVAIVPSLEGYDIRDYGARLFRHWKLGDAKRDDGVLLLVAPKGGRCPSRPVMASRA